MEETEQQQALSPDDELLYQFYRWELYGRGWVLWDEPIGPEPPFRPFFGFFPQQDCTDDGRKPTIVSGLFEWLHKKLRGKCHPLVAPANRDTEFIQPQTWDTPSGVTELRLTLPPALKVSKEASEQFLMSLSTCSGALSFELIGLPESISFQIACAGSDASHVSQQLQAIFPDVQIEYRQGYLAQRWREVASEGSVVVEFGLGCEFMLPLGIPRSFSVDPLANISAALAGVESGEIALIQVLFQPTRRPWAESILRSVTFADGTPFFAGVRDFISQSKRKISRPLYGAVIRVGARSIDRDRSLELVRRLASALGTLSDPEGNELIALENEGYDDVEHDEDLVLRRSHRCGMLLNSEELISLVHLPSESVRIPKLRGPSKKSKFAPALVLGRQLVLGVNECSGKTQTVTLSPEQRANHIHVIGASGTGNSTLLLNLIIQDLKNGDGVAVLDPHGDLVDAVLERLPADRVGDVVLFDPADEEYPVGFNILTAHSDIERNLLASDLVSVFRRLSTSWGDQMSAVLGNSILAMLESDQGGTLVDLRRFLVEPAFRRDFLSTVGDPEIAYYWTKEFPLLAGKPQAPVLTRLDMFLRSKLIRNMVGQKETQLDFAEVMDRKKIFLARLSHGMIGEENAHLLGTLLVSKFHQMAMGRQRQKETERQYFWLYIDEFQNFATPSMAAILSGARKYRLGLVLAHQDLYQLNRQSPDVASAVATNPYTRICFRLGDEDAKKIAAGFTSFDTTDFQNLGRGESICRIERADLDFNLRTLPLDEVVGGSAGPRDQALAHSRQHYARSRKSIEAELVTARGDIPAVEPAQRGMPEKTPIPHVGKLLSIAAVSSAPPPPRKKLVPATEPAPLGRGGTQHTYLQQLIKQYAEGLGYRASIEENVLGGT